MKMTALLIAGGVWQVPMAKFLSEEGLEITVVDPNLNPPAKVYAHNHIQLDVKDYDGIAKAIEGKSVSVVVSDQSDIAIPTVAKLNAQLGLAGNSLDAVRVFTNKIAMRNHAEQFGISVPEYHEVDTVESFDRVMKSCDTKMILKPSDAQSSRGVYVLEPGNASMNQLSEKFTESVKHSSDGHCILEEFFEGIEITIEGYKPRGKTHSTLAMSRKKHFRTGIASSLAFSNDFLPSEILDKIERANDSFVNHSDLEFGITHAEYLINPETGDFILVEIACRGGGNLIASHIIPWVSGVNVYELLLADARGADYTLTWPPVRSRKYAVLHFFEFADGKVTSIEGVEDSMRISGVLNCEIFSNIGDVIGAANDDRSRHGYVVIGAENQEQGNEILNRVISMIRVKTVVN